MSELLQETHQTLMPLNMPCRTRRHPTCVVIITSRRINLGRLKTDLDWVPHAHGELIRNSAQRFAEDNSKRRCLKGTPGDGHE